MEPTQETQGKGPDAMDVNCTYMDASEKEKLMKSDSFLRCKKQEHLSWECSTKKTTIQEAKVEETLKQNKKENAKKMPTTMSTSEEHQQKIHLLFSS